MGATSFMVKGIMMLLLCFAVFMMLIAMICFAANDMSGGMMCVFMAMILGSISMYTVTHRIA